ncbi:hypothetical protein [Alkalibacillus haloalkaliphilus]|uniref:hypothetical protein n=1 Tax=Alkalibacillus haloalkaliphilus TaxID=94136 RepID=UPI0002DD3DE9|nr:hypothetical protein [Alkalibacillus haloalkaliphilus]
MMEFLYFPEDKTLYIPAVITLIIFMILAFMFFRWMVKVSNKEEQAFNERFPNQNEHDQQNHNVDSKEQ